MATKMVIFVGEGQDPGQASISAQDQVNRWFDEHPNAEVLKMDTQLGSTDYTYMGTVSKHWGLIITLIVRGL